MPEQYILVERDEPIATATINRPDKLNALNWALVAELADRLEELDADDAIRCIVLTGAGERAFAAGADIAEMSGATPIQMATGAFEGWDRIRRIKKPIIAAVGGYALGGGNELAMHCDIIIASEKAQVRPAGDPDRHHARRGRHAAPGAHHWQVPRDGDLPDRRPVHRAADGGLGPRQPCRARWPAPRRGEEAGARDRRQGAASPRDSIKEAILTSFETPLEAALNYEKRLFALLFSTEDQKEGMRGLPGEAQARVQGSEQTDHQTPEPTAGSCVRGRGGTPERQIDSSSVLRRGSDSRRTQATQPRSNGPLGICERSETHGRRRDSRRRAHAHWRYAASSKICARTIWPRS